MRCCKTVTYRVLAVLLVMMICLTGCQTGKTSSDVGDGNSDSDVILDSEFENDTEMEPTGAEDSINSVMADGGDTSILDKSNPVYDRSMTEGKMAVYFISSTGLHEYCGSVMNHGDSILVIAPDGTTMLIDVQNPGLAPVIVATLDMLGIDTIDYLVITHPHSDHFGGYKTVMRYKTIKQVYNNMGTYTGSFAYNAFYDALAEAQIPITPLYQGDKFSVGEIDVEVLWPTKDYVHDNADKANMNNGSVTMLMTYKESSFLFAGDIEKETEAKLIEQYGDHLQADVHKMSHHGNATSSTREWIQTVLPKLAVAQANVVLDDKIMGRYYMYGSTVLSTGLNGTVVVWTSGNGKYDVQIEMENTYDFTELPDNYKDKHFVIK